MYGFKGEELLGVKGYLYRHGNYQLVPVSSWWEWRPECIWSHRLILIIVGSCVVRHIDHMS